jgi:uncharacterized repeat protein (TIGR03803 family)
MGGSRPDAFLLQATDGNIYGTASESGTKNNGTVFQLDVGAKTGPQPAAPFSGHLICHHSFTN